jgi:hypothetical protein
MSLYDDEDGVEVTPSTTATTNESDHEQHTTVVETNEPEAKVG